MKWHSTFIRDNKVVRMRFEPQYNYDHMLLNSTEDRNIEVEEEEKFVPKKILSKVPLATVTEIIKKGAEA